VRGALIWLGCLACAQAGTPDNRYIDASPQSIDGSTKLIDAHLIDAASALCTSTATCGTAADAIECTTPNGAAMGLDPQTRSILWGETGTFSNNKDDSRTVSIEIRPSGTSCSPSAPWSLTVAGD